MGGLSMNSRASVTDLIIATLLRGFEEIFLFGSIFSILLFVAQEERVRIKSKTRMVCDFF